MYKQKGIEMVLELFNRIAQESSTNKKMEILKDVDKDIEDIVKRVLNYTYDSILHTYNISMKNTTVPSTTEDTRINLTTALNNLDKLHSRQYTGNDAIVFLEYIFSKLEENDKIVLTRVINRDQRLGMGRTNINKVFPDLITKQLYQRCGVYTSKTKKKIEFPAIINLKADGTYREVTVPSLLSEGDITFHSRSGETYELPLLQQEFKILQTKLQGRFFGELTVELDDSLLSTLMQSNVFKNEEIKQEVVNNYNKGIKTLPRSIGNGLINSDDVPHENVYIDLWEYVSEEEYGKAARLKYVKNENQNRKKELLTYIEDNNLNSGKKLMQKELDKENKKRIEDVTTVEPYIYRFNTLKETVNSLNLEHIRIIEHEYVDTLTQATDKVQEWMGKGLEGGVLKNSSMTFKDGTNQEQLKMKLEISIELRVTGFTEGKVGTKRAETFGAIEFENDEGTIKGRTSGFSDDMLKEINQNREQYISKIIEVQCNDLTLSAGKTTYALSHPRFIEFRTDKDTTDTLERALELKESAKNFE